MKEIKFLKDLPIKLTNSNKKVLSVVGGDIYYDSTGNRYGYVTFNNVSKSPIFSIQLALREYSIDGKFIKDNEYFESYVFYPKGNFVINEPIQLDKETEAIDITIVKVTLQDRNFINDKFVGFKKEDYADLYPRKAPVKRPGSNSEFTFDEESINEQPIEKEFVPNEDKGAPAAQPSAEVEYEDGAPNDNGGGKPII